MSQEDATFYIYGYVPTLWIAALFIALFSTSTLLHIGQAIHYRLWFLLPTAGLAGIAEIIGWAGRLWSSKNPYALNPYLMQIVTTIIAPTPLIAANFVILGELIMRLGPSYSRLPPLWYTIIFCSCDIIALVIQAVGGAQAATAVQEGNDPNSGGNVMLGGIAFQLACITIYMGLGTEFVIRYLKDKPVRRNEGGGVYRNQELTHKLSLMLVGLTFSGIVIFIRSIYRTIELSNGFSGRIIETEVYFNVLDGGMITLAMFTMNFFHPGFLIGRGSWKHIKAKSDPEDDLKQPL